MPRKNINKQTENLITKMMEYQIMFSRNCLLVYLFTVIK
jgi:hypothetical protein